VTDDAPVRLERLILGTERGIPGTVYGSIVVLATLATGADAYEHDLWRLASLAGSTVVVLWVAHVYAHGLGESVEAGRRLNVAEFTSVAGREFSILLAAVLPLAAIALGAAGVLKSSTAIWLALGVGVLTLAAQGLRYARIERLTPGGTIVSVALNLALGLVIVGLKILVAH
jgi:hypothetical protein